MMRRLLPLMLAVCLLLCACTARDPISPMVSTVTDAPVPAPADDAVAPHAREVTLWFRFGSEPFLAPETRTLALAPTAPFELTLLQALTGGPAASSLELSGLFPPGVRVLATHLQGRTLFVTLSRQIMNDYADESAALADECRLRRRLAMQAIAATVTENCDVDQVVILVEQTGRSSDSLRLRLRYYRDGGADGLAAPLIREESVLLTPGNTLHLLLTCWQTRSWPQLYDAFVARHDPATGEARPAWDAFIAQADALPHLTGFTASGGSVSPDGQSAVFSVTLTLLDGGQTRPVTVTLRLHRERGIWRIGLSQLTGREGELP